LRLFHVVTPGARGRGRNVPPCPGVVPPDQSNGNGTTGLDEVVAGVPAVMIGVKPPVVTGVIVTGVVVTAVVVTGVGAGVGPPAAAVSVPSPLISFKRTSCQNP
ncbi:UNVERIFIED_CONTAM: hypothetical protein K2H54_059343, partial [Gekko kuhli]